MKRHSTFRILNTMKECKLCSRQFPTVRGRNIHVTRCHQLKHTRSLIKGTKRRGPVLPNQRQHKQPRNQSAATVAYISGRPQPMRAVNCADNGGNVPGGKGIKDGGGAIGSGNRQQMDGISSNERKRRNDKDTNNNGDGFVWIHEPIEEHAEQGQEAADDDGTLERQIKRAKLLYYNTNIVESQLRADLLRMKIVRMERKAKE